MLIVITPDVSWVRSLFEAMPDHVEVRFINLQNLRERWRWSTYPWRKLGRWNAVQRNIREIHLLLPTFFRGITRWVTWHFIRAAIRRSHDPLSDHVIIYTAPWHELLLDPASGIRSAYLVHDPFTFYECWDPKTVVRQEQQLLQGCDFALVVCRELMNDFQTVEGRTAKLISAPNGVHARQTIEPRPEPPADLPRGKPIVGCVGRINDTFDLEWVEQVAAENPAYAFVFIGPLVENHPTLRTLLEKRLHSPHILWLGARPHEELAAYLANFDVCLCPLRKTAHNDRRCPLRFFDYMAAGRPIITTPITEAYEHEKHLHIVKTPTDATAALEGLRTGAIPHDSEAMRNYARKNTWAVRATTLLGNLNLSTTSPPLPPVSSGGNE